MRLPLDHNATVKAIIADGQVLYTDVEVNAPAREVEQNGVPLRRIDPKLGTYDALASDELRPAKISKRHGRHRLHRDWTCLEGKTQVPRSGETINESCTLPRRLRA